MFHLAQKAGNFGSRIVKISSTDRLKLVRMMSSLIQNQAFINGKWTNASDNGSFEVTNPANQTVIAEIPDMKINDVQRAIDAAHDAFYSKAWQDSTGKERSGMLKVSFFLEIHSKPIINFSFLEMVPPSRVQQGRARQHHDC